MAACTLYNICFFTYIWLMPVFLQFLIRAPSNFDPAPFYPVPMRTLSGDVPELYMSSFPQTTRPGVNHCRPCQEMGGQRSGMYQWDIMLSISEKDLIKESKDKPVSTMYPLVFASNDAKTWKVVADADDVAGKGHWAGKNNDADEATHLSAPLLVANLKNFGCIDDETSDTDPFFHHFTSKEKALQYKWRLVKHVAMHGSVNLVACVMQGLDDVNQLIHTYARDCLYQGEMKCHLTPGQALGKCFAIGSACGQACGYFSPKSPVCRDGTLDRQLFAGLTQRRVKIKTSPGGGGAAEALVYCSKSPCNSGMHFNNMYVEAENPIEFLKAQMDAKNKEKGSYYLLMFAMSDFHAPMHTFEVVSDDDKDDEDEEEGEEGAGKEDEKEDEKKDHEDSKDDEEKSDEKKDDGKDEKKEPAKKDEKKEEKPKEPKHTTKKPTKKPKKKPEKRTCVDLPGVRLAEIDHSGLAHFVDHKGTDNPLGCTAWCGQHKECQQSVFAQANKGCYLFKIPTVEVRNYSTHFNSSYCGPSSDKSLMMTMLHQAYKNYVPPEPKKPLEQLRRLGAEIGDDMHGRRLQAPNVVSSSTSEEVSANKKYYWQIAHVPNGTRGVLTDQGANEVRVIPRNTSCFTTPGFVYMVACMTAKPVYVPDRTHPLRPPPFNDRCLAVGGLCGATCGSGQQVTEHVARYCPLQGATGRRLQGGSPYASAHIPRDMMVQRIDPQRNSNQGSYAARVFFNLFIFIAVVSYISTILSKFPGLFFDRHPIHTWDEIHMHGYLADKFGCAVTCNTSVDDEKSVVLRNWVGKITTRPQFDDTAFGTFRQWVDVFCDEGHREGARLLWMAWTEFLETNPPIEFLQAWSEGLRDMSPGGKVTPFDLKGPSGKKVLPVIPGQHTGFGEEAPAGGTTLQPDSLARLKDLAEVYRSLPDDMCTDRAMSNKDDVVLTKRMGMDLKAGSKPQNKSGIMYSNGWQREFGQKVEARVKELQTVREKYEKSLVVTDRTGKKVPGGITGAAANSIKQEQFPLLVREPLQTKGRQVVMVYCARGKPETDRKGVEKTRGMDKYLWASLRPAAVRKNDKDKSKSNLKKGGAPEEKPLLDDASERSFSSVGQPNVEVLEEVRKAVEKTVERQHNEVFDGEPEEADEKAKSSEALSKLLTKGYLELRSVDSDWEMSRFCYGEVVGEEKDQDGDTVVVLDNPSAALLALVADPPAVPEGQAPAMGLVTFEGDEGKDCFGNSKRTVRASKPSLQFKFVNTRPDSPETQNFPKEMRQRLQQTLADPSLDLNKLKILETRKGNELVVDVTGPGPMVELIRSKNIRDLQVVNYKGRMMDTHPCIAVKKSLLMPFEGVRGVSGGLNFVVDLLQFREGFIGSGRDQDPTPERMLVGVFDSKQQPHPDFWKKCLPKFMMNTDKGYTYKVNDEIALVQAPELSGGDDGDSLMGASLSILNMIRNRCAGVTSSGTNVVWQVSAKQFSRADDEAVTKEFFETQTLIPGTATTHARFSSGARSVYVQEKVASGLANDNAECLASMQRQAEGSVQLFWVELLINRRASILKGLLAMLLLLGLMYFILFGPTSKDVIGYNFFCDSGTPSLLLGADHPVCTKLCDLFGSVLARNGDKVRFQLAEHDYMQLIEMSICWLLLTISLVVVAGFLAMSGKMPPVVRIFIMVENITYWMTSWNIFYWLALVLFMVIGMDPPLLFNGSHFMFFALLINLAQHCMLNEYKSMSDCTEISIWRSQQSYTLAAPLYIAAIVQGTINAWYIILGKRDCSYWNSTTTPEVVTAVTVWVTVIWAAFVCCIGVILAINVVQLALGQTASQLQGEEHFSAAALIGLIAITVWEPFLNLWGMDARVEATSKNEKTASCRQRCFAKLMMWWRSKAWILRYIIDFVIPIMVLAGVLKGSHMLITLVAYAGTVHGLRM